MSLKPDPAVVTKSPRKAAAAPGPPACVLCGGPAFVVDVANDPGWQLQSCDACGRHRRRADIAAKGLA